MAMNLFEHNAAAYQAAVTMLAERGKACVIHPTGTGKSFIGFKLCEDNPDKTICWLSPSDYIFKTQLENLATVSDGWTPENIVFSTYAKLAYLTDDDYKQMCPDFIVLDEFHRCGADVWGHYVKRLLTLFPDVPILGLSATAIRSLDNQRDMADELFDGNIASEITLGEAIVRGIGMDFSSRKQTAFENGYAHLKSYVAEHGDADVSIKYVCADGFRLGIWVVNHRRLKNKLSNKEVILLDALGMIWNVPEYQWRQMYQYAEEYYKTHGSLAVPQGYCVPNGKSLYEWLLTQRRKYQDGKLSTEQIELLKRIDFRFEALYRKKSSLSNFADPI